MREAIGRARAARGAALAGAALILAACSSTGSGPNSGEGFAGRIFGAPATQEARKAEVVTDDRFAATPKCPRIEIRPGTEALVVRAKPTREQTETGVEPPVRWQAAITNTARECRLQDGATVVKLGIAGRVIAGQAGGAGKVTLPIRVALIQDGETVLSSQLYKLDVNLAEPDFAADFSKIEDGIVVPQGPPGAGYKFYIGFDESGAKR